MAKNSRGSSTTVAQSSHNHSMFPTQWFAEFDRTCVARIAAGEVLSNGDAYAFHCLLEARERAGHRLLGAMAGPDASFDTVSGRCGHRPPFTELRR